jgi:uroporphyrin-III C-methyltransferase
MNKIEKDQHKDNRVGKIFICGAGPGDPKLLTIRAMELINESDVILYDRLIGKDIVKLFPEYWRSDIPSE